MICRQPGRKRAHIVHFIVYLWVELVGIFGTQHTAVSNRQSSDSRQDVSGFIDATDLGQPTWALWKERQGEEENEKEDDLERERCRQR